MQILKFTMQFSVRVVSCKSIVKLLWKIILESWKKNFCQCAFNQQLTSSPSSLCWRFFFLSLLRLNKNIFQYFFKKVHGEGDNFLLVFLFFHSSSAFYTKSCHFSQGKIQNLSCHFNLPFEAGIPGGPGGPGSPVSPVAPR